MTVKEFITALKKMDPTAEVIGTRYAGYYDIVNSVAIKPIIKGSKVEEFVGYLTLTGKSPFVGKNGKMKKSVVWVDVI